MAQNTKADAAAATHGQGRDARSVANSLIMKLVYISHGWMLGLYNKSLFKQPVLAWLYGPVVSDIYHGLRKYRSCLSG